ncbi:UPF0122 protein [Clostridia bacterium]|nr:UPF0122 protein [Clostridia bacterium]
MEKIVELTLLYDFYGELLSEHQKEVYEAVVFSDLSYQEAAEQYAMSKQGIYDLVKRSLEKLKQYELKLGLIEKFRCTKQLAQNLQQQLQQYLFEPSTKRLEQIQEMVQVLIQALE